MVPVTVEAREVAMVSVCRGLAEFFLEWGGSPWGWGRAGQGELGPTGQQSAQTSPMLCHTLPRVCGRWSGSRGQADGSRALLGRQVASAFICR